MSYHIICGLDTRCVLFRSLDRGLTDALGLVAARREAVFGVNKYKPVNEAAIDVLKVENSTVRRLQIDKLKRLRFVRAQKELYQALAPLTRVAGQGHRNLLALQCYPSVVKAAVC